MVHTYTHGLCAHLSTCLQAPPCKVQAVVISAQCWLQQMFSELNSKSSIHSSRAQHDPGLGYKALQSQVWVSTLLLTTAWWPRTSDFTSLFLFPHLSSGENGSNIDHQDAVRVKQCAACKAISTEKDTWWSGNSTGCSQIMIMIIIVVVLHQGWRLAVLSWRAWLENGARPHLQNF